MIDEKFRLGEGGFYDKAGGAGPMAIYSSSAPITAAQVKSHYESNPDTNVFTDGEKAALAALTSGRRGTIGSAIPAARFEVVSQSIPYNTYTKVTSWGTVELYE